ncbi:adenosylcobinamide-GDP ribazoletransferase [Tumebacillus permanentifrigoris]|uniref:Adenosylcobinamide-GDP ribazoletransferase n=1 Tax=Tumebacillus permanentifrigoris TaxID=378543 RepID=A0A316DAK4_9BACL|nr:adenosylcobinamide-GDP ribazoletransferase [Tumebacillus permanentifrigoris]PWK14822.1 cobalamin-5'-phosphate synthase [Tumebacillus permanentifrigoris]
MIQSFFQALGFLTRIPVPRNLDPDAWKSSPPWYPVVGLLIGVLLASVGSALEFVTPPLVEGMLVLTCWVYLTGGLHLDGLMDTADGFGSYRSRERILEIMKDSRVGGMGVLAAILVLGNKLAALFSLHAGLQIVALVVAPMMGRGAMMAAMYLFPYAREEGLGLSLRTSGRAFGWSFFLLIVAVFVAKGGVVAVFTCGLTLVASTLIIRSSMKKIGGLTGDVYGTICEVTEAVVLLAFVVAEKLLWN